MSMEEVSKTAVKAFVELVIKAAWKWAIKRPWLVAPLLGGVAYFATPITQVLEGLLKHPEYGKVLFALLVVVVSLMAVWIVRMYRRYERFRPAFGVQWDGNYNMRCSSCNKPLKNATDDRNLSLFFCPGPECGVKYVLRDTGGKKVTQQEAIDWLKKNPK